MALCENNLELWGGALVSFQRNLAVAVSDVKTHREPTWFIRLKIAGLKGFFMCGTNLTKYEGACAFTRAEYWRTQQAA